MERNDFHELLAMNGLKSVIPFAMGLIISLTAATQHSVHGQITANWLAGSGNWNEMSMWDTGVVPNNTTQDFYDVVIDSNPGIMSVVRILALENYSIDRLTIDQGDELAIEANAILEIVRDDNRPDSGTIVNSGSLRVDSNTGPGLSVLRLETPVTLQGGGSLSLVGSNAYVTDSISTADGSLVNQDNLIQGSGFLGNNRLQLTNESMGLIDANINGSTLQIRSRHDVDIVNAGTIQSSLGGILNLSGHTNGLLDNTNGTIQALDGSFVDLTLQVSIFGGEIRGISDGKIRVPSFNSATITDSTIDNVCVDNNSNLLLAGIIDNGNLFINGEATGQSRVLIHSDTTLTGNGTINLTGLGARLIDLSANQGHLVNADNTICGVGIIGGGQMQLTNQSAGLIDANVSGEVLAINTRNGVDLINDGVLRSTNGGNLRLHGFSNGILDNSNGQIIVGDTSLIDFRQTIVIVGGTLLAEGSGQFNTGEFATVQLENLNLATPFLINGNSNLRLAGTIHNQIIDIDGSIAASSNLIFNSDATLDGNSVINMIGPGARIITSAGVANDGRLINVNNLIRGQGSLGVGRLELTNQTDGVISADIAGTTMSVQTEGGQVVFNAGTIEARNGATLQINGFGADLDNSGGTICALEASLVELKNNLVLSGGMLKSSGSGQILVPVSQFVTFDDLTVEGDVDIDGFLTVTETLNNDANIVLSQTGTLRVTTSPAKIAGSGNLNLSAVGSQVVGTTNNNGLEVVGGKLSGVGRFLVDTQFRSGAVVAPGNSIGSLVFDGNRTNQFIDGVVLEIELDSVTGTPGVNWDFLDVVNGTIDFDDDMFPSSVVIKPMTLDPNGNPGPLANFDADSDFSLPIAQAHTITGFESGNFVIDLSHFENEASGTFCVALDSSGTDTLLLNYFALLLGDVNGDCLVNLLDVQPFINAITTGTYIPQADINQDGLVNLLDVEPFVALLGG